MLLMVGLLPTDVDPNFSLWLLLRKLATTPFAAEVLFARVRELNLSHAGGCTMCLFLSLPSIIRTRHSAKSENLPGNLRPPHTSSEGKMKTKSFRAQEMNKWNMDIKLRLRQ